MGSCFLAWRSARMRNDSSTNATRGKLPAAVRCAIYTRKSTEEGLDQEFNSLHAQREAIEQAALSSGALFRSLNRHGQVQPGRLSGTDVARVVKKLAQRAGLDAVKYAGHSLRAGHATAAAVA